MQRREATASCLQGNQFEPHQQLVGGGLPNAISAVELQNSGNLSYEMSSLIRIPTPSMSRFMGQRTHFHPNLSGISLSQTASGLQFYGSVRPQMESSLFPSHPYPVFEQGPLSGSRILLGHQPSFLITQQPMVFQQQNLLGQQLRGHVIQSDQLLGRQQDSTSDGQICHQQQLQLPDQKTSGPKLPLQQKLDGQINMCNSQQFLNLQADACGRGRPFNLQGNLSSTQQLEQDMHVLHGIKDSKPFNEIVQRSTQMILPSQTIGSLSTAKSRINFASKERLLVHERCCDEVNNRNKRRNSVASLQQQEQLSQSSDQHELSFQRCFPPQISQPLQNIFSNHTNPTNMQEPGSWNMQQDGSACSLNDSFVPQTPQNVNNLLQPLQNVDVANGEAAASQHPLILLQQQSLWRGKQLQQQALLQMIQQQKRQTPNNQINYRSIRPRTVRNHQMGNPIFHSSYFTQQLPRYHSPQISGSSQQCDQQSFLTSISETGTTQSICCPSFAPSPSTQVLTPSSTPEKRTSGDFKISNSREVECLMRASGSALISTSHLPEECISQDAHCSDTANFSGKRDVTEKPIESSIKIMGSMSSKAYGSSTSEIASAGGMPDNLAPSTSDSGSRSSVVLHFLKGPQDSQHSAKELVARGESAAPSQERTNANMTIAAMDIAASPGSVSYAGSKRSRSLSTCDFASTASSDDKRQKRQKFETRSALNRELEQINQKLVGVYMEISGEDADSIASSVESEGTVVSCSLSMLAMCPDLRALFVSKDGSVKFHVALLVPANYPDCSPVLLDKLPENSCEATEDPTTKAKSRFIRALRCLAQPISLWEMAMTWSACAHNVVADCAQQMGGGCFSSMYGTWEKCGTS